jgi:hypothetical protein
MLGRRDSPLAVTLVFLLLAPLSACGRDLPTSSGIGARARIGGAGHPGLDASSTTLLAPQASGTLRHLPEMGVLDIAPVASDLQSSYFRTTETNREFRRGVAEFAIPDFSGDILAAKLVLRENRAVVGSPELPPDHHELSFYTDVDLVVDPSDFDRPSSSVATFDTDGNLQMQTFEFDVTELVTRMKGSRLGFRVKLADDPTYSGMGFQGTAFSPSSDPPGVTLEVVTSGSAQAIDHLEEVIRAMGLPEGVEASLLGPLQQAARLLEDGDPRNDQAACAKLGAFLEEVDAKEQSGQLSAEQATELESLAQDIETGLGCSESSS